MSTPRPHSTRTAATAPPAAAATAPDEELELHTASRVAVALMAGASLGHCVTFRQKVEVDGLGWNVLGGHAVQPSEDGEAAVAEYKVPAGQPEPCGLHSVALTLIDDVPGGHGTQVSRLMAAPMRSSLNPGWPIGGSSIGPGGQGAGGAGPGARTSYGVGDALCLAVRVIRLKRIGRT